jgi:L-fuconolactonase
VVTVDAHCHVSPIWYEPVETLLFEMDRNDVEAAILIQMLGQTDNVYQMECLSRYPGRFASVVIVDHTLPTASRLLEDLAEEGASGVRLRATMRSPGEDPFAIWRTADRLGLAVSCAGTASEFASSEFQQLLEALPNLTIVVEHLAHASRPDTTEAEREQRYATFRTLSASYFHQAFDAFGPDRMMWGSDFPPVAGREGYTNALNMSRDQFANRPAEARDKIFGDTAANTFKIR